jgi:heme/copper-type cytochrome/quinol oxidase subunit 2
LDNNEEARDETCNEEFSHSFVVSLLQCSFSAGEVDRGLGRKWGSIGLWKYVLVIMLMVMVAMIVLVVVRMPVIMVMVIMRMTHLNRI